MASPLVDAFVCTDCGEHVVTNPYVLTCGHLLCSKCLPKEGEETPHCTVCFCAIHSIPKVSNTFQDFLVDLTKTNTVDTELISCCICLDSLWKPSVASCGHWFCFWCIDNCHSISCPLCRDEWRCKPKIFTVLHNFLVKHVPNLENERAEPKFIQETTTDPLIVLGEDGNVSMNSSYHQIVLLNLNNPSDSFNWYILGCDGCGEFPLKGPSIFRCIDCPEAIGFDLCAGCNEHHQKTTMAEFEGRYGQNHNPNTHRIVELTSSSIVAKVRQEMNVPEDVECALQ